MLLYYIILYYIILYYYLPTIIRVGTDDAMVTKPPNNKILWYS